ncbi:hypothetical protein ISREJYDI_CDS0047 [Pseudomonas phage UNO-G1W1]|uniref:Uncharacterized protein n=1 Tax=Pseudomonas phage UNO-G1W1 TaxID=3136609 RepID=A0AAX4QMX0_9CAUD
MQQCHLLGRLCSQRRSRSLPEYHLLSGWLY